MGDSQIPGMDAVISIHDHLLGWLRDHALPLWDAHGVDRGAGGYFESVEFASDGAVAVTGAERRGRVVARQIYVFDIGHHLGWRSEFASPLDHGCDFLFAHLHEGNGIFHTSVDAVTRVPLAPFSLYEHAFYLFALSRLTRSAAGRYPVVMTALQCLQQLRSSRGKANGGFTESVPPTLPLKSNPHMHLLEAALAWIHIGDASLQPPWIGLAREIVGLCLTQFVDARTGAVREYFDHEWRPLPGDSGRIVEPGHQFEWAWLLLQWARSGHVDGAERRAASDAAARLLDLGERWGVDHERGVAINEIYDDMSIKDSAAKLWPQTERLKAWCAVLDGAQSVDAAGIACQKIVLAARGLARYLLDEPAGLWREVWSADGSFVPGPSKASSFYHVVCAIEVLRQTVSAQRTSVVYSAPRTAAIVPAAPADTL